MITYSQAKQIALNYLQEIKNEIGIEVAISSERAENFGWIFTYQSSGFLETNDFLYALAGNAPFVVDASDGRIHILGTSKSIDEYIVEYSSIVSMKKPTS